MVNQKDDGPSWEQAMTLEQWAEKELRAGNWKAVRDLVNTLPEVSRQKYRDIFVRIREEKKKRTP